MKSRMCGAVLATGRTSRLCLASALLCVPFVGDQVVAAEGQAVTLESFLACAAQKDRGARIACLEDALELATSAGPAQTVSAAGPAVASPVVSESPRSDGAEPQQSEASLLDRVREFGRGARVSDDADGGERLHDTIAGLEKRSNLWVITLASGQVWRQDAARTFNLRVGDEVEIYREGVGNGLRLSTPRLSGFIRVERVR